MPRREKCMTEGVKRRLRREEMEGQVLAPPWTFLTCSLEEGDACTGRGEVSSFLSLLQTSKFAQNLINHFIPERFVNGPKNSLFYKGIRPFFLVNVFSNIK